LFKETSFFFDWYVPKVINKKKVSYINRQLKKKVNNFKYTGCQIINKEILANKNVTYFPMSEIWNTLERENKLYGFEYSGEFLHLTDIEIYNKLFISKN
jgi:hypothetical protein